ncbi:MAG TPA: alginate export family protein [Usitatibacter sp.]|nr:alginate export family protein [Usitatibacter sp.]
MRARARHFVGAVLASMGADAAEPPCPTEATGYKFLRFDESYTYLKRPECAVDEFDSIKFRELGIGGARISFGGDIRVRMETGQDLRYYAAPPDTRNDVQQRYHGHVDLRIDDTLRFFAELKVAEVAGRPVPLPSDEDGLDVHQAFVEWQGESTRARLGRQEFMFGGNRRLFPRTGPNVKGSYDAARVTQQWGDWAIDLLAFKPVSIDPGAFDDVSIDSQRFWAAYATGPTPWSGLRADFYYIGLERDATRFVQGVADEKRHSIGARLFGRLGAWDHDHEVTLQAGTFGSGDIRAWAVEGEVGYTVPDQPTRPRVSLRYDAGSGDRDPANPNLETFNSIFPRGGVTTDVFGFSPANLLHLRLALEQRIAPRLAIVVSADGVWRTSVRDGLYGAGANVLVVGASSRSRYVGWDVDTTINWRVSRQVVLGISAGYFRNGTYSREAGFPDRQWIVAPVLYIQL